MRKFNKIVRKFNKIVRKSVEKCHIHLKIYMMCRKTSILVEDGIRSEVKKIENVHLTVRLTIRVDLPLAVRSFFVVKEGKNG